MNQEIIRIDLDGVNCYLGREDENFILIDTGGHMFLDKKFDNRRQMIEKELENHGCNAANLKLIILTHGDNDHAANAAYLRGKYHAKIAMHPDDISLVDHPTIEKLMENNRYHSIILKLVFLIMRNRIRKLIKKTLNDFDSFKPDLLIGEGFDLSEYGFQAKIIHIPGHTRGSVGVLTEQGDFVSGDLFANTGKPSIAPNACDFKVLYQSVKKIKSIDIKTIFPGHGKPFDAALINPLS